MRRQMRHRVGRWYRGRGRGAFFGLLEVDWSDEKLWCSVRIPTKGEEEEVDTWRTVDERGPVYKDASKAPDESQLHTLLENRDRFTDAPRLHRAPLNGHEVKVDSEEAGTTQCVADREVRLDESR